MPKIKKKANIGIIGLGKFGMSLAIELATMGKNIVCLDKDEKKVREVLNYCDYAYVSDDISQQTLEDSGFGECDIVVIGVGGEIDVSILMTLNVAALGVKKIIAKANSEDQGKVLEKLGAEVIYPEKDSADRLAKRIRSNNILDFISLNEHIDICEVKVPKKFFGQTIRNCDLRGKYNVNIIAIEIGDGITTNINPDHVFEEGDTVILIGDKKDILNFEAK